MSSPQAPHLNPLAPQRVRRLAPSACLGAEKEERWRNHGRCLAELQPK